MKFFDVPGAMPAASSLKSPWRQGKSERLTDPCSMFVGAQRPRKNSGSHIDASHSRQPLVKGERLVRYEVNAVMLPDWRMQAGCDR